MAKVINATNKEYYIGCESNSGVSLLPFPENISNYYSLRSTLIFEGGRIQRGNYIGKWVFLYVSVISTYSIFSLFLIYQSGNQYITSNGFDSVVIVNLEASNNTDRLLIQESICKSFFFWERCKTFSIIFQTWKISITLNWFLSRTLSIKRL